MPNIKKRVKCNCDCCGAEIEKVYAEYHRTKYHFCNKECFYLFNRGENNCVYNQIKFTCDWCNKESSISKSPYNRAKKHFCSKECWMKYKGRNNIETICYQCGKKIIRIKSTFNLSAYHFCSVNCKNKWHSEQMFRENNPSWMGGISFEPYSSDWTDKLKIKIRERDYCICQKCGEYGNIIHHIDYNKKNCKESNLITLCQSCHGQTCFNRDFWIEKFKEVV